MGGLDLSIVIATLNREPLLLSCIDSIVSRVSNLSYEIIVVNGGHPDVAFELGKRYVGIRVIDQPGRVGAIKAYNAGFRLASAEFTIALNDDLVVRDSSLQDAVDLLRVTPNAGQVAIPFQTPFIQKPKLDFVTLLRQKWLYANFGMTRTDLGHQLNWWGNHYYHYAGDVELSMKIWNAGHSVIPLYAGCLWHIEVQDGTRVNNKDSPVFYKDWQAWKGIGDEDARFVG